MTNTKSFSASDLARNTGDILDAASRHPVTITKHSKPRFVLMSFEYYEAEIEKNIAIPQTALRQPAAPKPAASLKKSIKLRVSFWIERNSKFVRGKKRAYEDIENFVLYPFAMKRHGQGDYTITVEYKDDQDLDEIANSILAEIYEYADLRNCFPGDEMIEVVGDPDRCWG